MLPLSQGRARVKISVSPPGNRGVEGVREIAAAVEAAFGDEVQRPCSLSDLSIRNTQQQRSQIRLVLRSAFITGKDLQRNQVSRCGHGDDDAGEKLDPVCCLDDLSFDARDRKQEVYDNAFFGLTWRYETNRRQTTEGFLLDRCQNDEAVAHKVIDHLI